jgi:hypothetical protein
VATVIAPSPVGATPERAGPATVTPAAAASRDSSEAAWAAGSSARFSGGWKTVKPPLTSSAESGPTSLSIT